MSQTFTELLAAADGTRTTAGETSEGPQAPSSSLNLSVPETWQQGRAIFGGLTAAICLDAATPFAGNRPLRTAQITFIGPASGQLTATASPVRLGKNTAFVAVTLTNDLGIAASAMLVFGQARSSQHSV